jgi:hypothetical protein
MTLASGSSYAALVGIASSTCTGLVRVTPGSVPNSYLMNKLSGSGICNGTQMPKAGSALPASNMSAITGWICQGAPKN